MTLKEARKKRKMTQKQLSEATGIPLSTIRSYENDEEKVSIASIGNILKVTKELNIKVSDLVSMEKYQKEVAELITEWESMTEKSSFDDIYKTYYNKIYRWFRRSQITNTEYKQITIDLKNKKCEYTPRVQEDGYLTPDLTQTYIEDLNHLIIEYFPSVKKRENKNSSIDNFKRMRLIRDISLEQLAYCTGMNKQTFKNYESGQRSLNSMSTGMAIKVVIVLKCNIEDIFVI